MQLLRAKSCNERTESTESIECSFSEPTAIMREDRIHRAHWMQLLRAKSYTERGQNPQGPLNAASRSQQLYWERTESTEHIECSFSEPNLYWERTESTGSIECNFSEPTALLREDRIHRAHWIQLLRAKSILREDRIHRVHCMQLLRAKSILREDRIHRGPLYAGSQSQQLYWESRESTGSIECSFSEPTTILRKDRIHRVHWMQLLRVYSSTERGQNPQGTLNAASQSQQPYWERTESTRYIECSFSDSTALLREDRIHRVHWMQLFRANSCTERGQNPHGTLNAASQSQQLYWERTESTGSTECSFSEPTAVQREDRIHRVHWMQLLRANISTERGQVIAVTQVSHIVTSDNEGA